MSVSQFADYCRRIDALLSQQPGYVPKPPSTLRDKWKGQAARAMLEAVRNGEDIATAAARIHRRWHRCRSVAELIEAGNFAREVLRRRPALFPIQRNPWEPQWNGDGYGVGA